MKRYYIVFRGNVQGVGFRFFAQKEAQKLNLFGWIRNRPDGTVDMEIDGTETLLMNYINELKTKHPWANVSSADIKEKSISNPYNEFQIRF
ncbi:MAG: acylphosphatase [bacterium]